MAGYAKYAVVLVIIAALVAGYALYSGGPRGGAATSTIQTNAKANSTTLSSSVRTTTAIPIASPQAYWKFDEGSGTTAYDSSGNGNAATLVNSPEWVAGKTGYALGFNGNNQYLSTNYSGVSGDGARTFTAWIRTTSCFKPVCDVLTYGSESPGARIEWSVEGNDLGLRVYDAYIVYSAPNLTNGNWHFIAIVIPQGAAPIGARMYEDGQLLGTVTESQFDTSSIDTGSAHSVNIGRMYAGANVVGTPAPRGTAYFNGSIDDLRIYNAALNASQIQGLYAA
ncbi:MAG: LamG domain-containing protein [Candidatus Micrarchaeota archaeon]|nr:LamG domain-containing protein [Candidatus Micrarchaeota archaeon]